MIANPLQPPRTLSDDNAPLWNLLGLAGVLGVVGLWRSSDNDGYTEDTSEFQ